MSGRLLVVAQFVLIGLLLWPVGATSWLRAITAVVAAIPGVAFGLWTLWHNRPGNFNIRPDLKPGATLIMDGPYALVRHPMYVCVLWLGLCAVLFYASPLKLVAWIALFSVLRGKAHLEEGYLCAQFPEYPEYAQKVSRFWPRRLPG